MMVVCAWCKDLIHDETPAEQMPDVISHGICPRCFERAEAEIMALTAAGDHATVTDADVGGEG